MSCQFNQTRRAGMLLPVVMLLLCVTAVRADPMKIYLMIGQSNMEGQAYTYDNQYTDNWNIPTMEFLLSGTAAANNYVNNMPFTFKNHLTADWLNPRNDVWSVHYDSTDNNVRDVLPTDDLTGVDIYNGIGPLSPGFGVGTRFGSMFGAELALGQRLGDALQSPVFLFKSNKGGTTIGGDWRPPSAGGTTGDDYTNMVNQFKGFLDGLDADLADDGVLNNYGNATGYQVSGVIWLQGWNDRNTAEATYRELLVDLVEDIRASDDRIADDLPAVIIESSDQSSTLNAARSGAVAALNADNPGSAVFIETNQMKDSEAYWGNNENDAPFSTGWGFHFHARAENFLEIGWLAGDQIIANGYTEGTLIPEPSSAILIAASGLALFLRYRR